MDVIHSAADLRARLQREPNNVFVPTMGNLHDGHIQLINIAKPRAACTVVSIFVNRLQFGPREDFDRYPRTLEADSARLKAAGVDVLFVPDEKEIYPEPQTFVVEPSDLQFILEGAHRPGHFRGVATVVLKLFNLVMPHSAIFGKKAKFVKNFMRPTGSIQGAVELYVKEVKARTFPGLEHSFSA